MTTASAHFVERTCCPCCESYKFITVYQCAYSDDPIRQYLIDFYEPQGGVDFNCLQDASYVLRHCQSCSLIYQAQIGNDSIQRKLYEEWIDAARAKVLDDQNRGLNDHVLYAREIITVLTHLGKLPAQTRILDFGMGWGRWCRMAKGFGCQVFGTELSEARINYARSQGIEVISWNKIPLNRYDFINAEQVFEHLPEPLETLKHLSLGLSEGGLIKISVPDGKNVLQLLRKADWTATKNSAGSLNAVAPLEHINCFRHETLVSLARHAGLKVVPMKADTYIAVELLRDGHVTASSRLARVKRAIIGFVPRRAQRAKSTYLFMQRL